MTGEDGDAGAAGAGGRGGGRAGGRSGGDARDDGDEQPDGTGRGEARDGPDLLAEAVDRMAHQIKNPLQAVAMNLEVIRMRVRDEAPELWSEIERHGEAVDQNVHVLDRRLRLLLRLGRRSTGEAPESVDVARLIDDFAAALELGEPPSAMVVRTEGTQLAARARPGYVLALALDLWHVARTRSSGTRELPVTVRTDGGEVIVEVGLPAAAASAASTGPPRARWERTARAAGGRLETGGNGGGPAVRLVLPTD